MKEGLNEGEKISPFLYRMAFAFFAFISLVLVPPDRLAHMPAPSYVQAELEKPIQTQVAEASVQIEEKKPDIDEKQFEKKIPYHGIILQVASRYEVDPALIRAIIMAESGYNPRAVSKKGAIGLMQLMPRTARELGVKEPFNPEHNIEAGVKYFKKLLKQFRGDVRLAVAAYNAGSRKVRRYRGVPPIRATRYYVRKVFHYYEKYKKEMGTGHTDNA